MSTRPESLPDDPELRRKIAQELGSGKDPHAVGLLASFLRDEDVDVRLAAVESLESLGAERRIDGTSELFYHPPQEECAMALTVALDDENGHIRWRAAKALGELASFGSLGSWHSRVVSELVRLLGDDNKHVAWAAADVLEVIGDSEAREKVRRFKQLRG